MKKSNFTSLVIFFIFTLLFWIIPDYVSADLRHQYPPSPCHILIEHDLDSAWYINPTEPKQKMICLNFNNCPNCCYRITYYDYTDKKLPNLEDDWDEYNINIVDIQWMGSNSCCEKDKETIQQLFLDTLMNEKIQDTSYHPLQNPYDTIFYFYLFTSAVCQKGDSVCSDTFCCLQTYSFSIDPNSPVYHKPIKKTTHAYIGSPICDSANLCVFICDDYSYRENWIDCCDSIQVTSHKIDSTCCVNISVYNPYCWDPAPDIIFQQFNTLTHTFLTVPNGTINCPMGQTVNYTMCPTNGDYFVIWRVKISKKDSSAIPNCGTSFFEGKTMYTDTVDLSSCCKCDPNWLIVTVVKDSSCQDSGCKVRFILNIPDSITCYKYFVVENNQGTKDLPPKVLDSLPQYSLCLNKGDYGTVKLYLLQNIGEIPDSACIIPKGVACDTATINCCPSNHNDWLTTIVVKDPTCPDSNGCRVFMNWTNLDSIPPCFHYYYVQGIDNEIVAGYNNLYNQPISSVQYCIGAGQSGTIKVTLVNDYENPNIMCTITKNVSCDSTNNDTSSTTRFCNDCPEEWLPAGENNFGWKYVDIGSGCELLVKYKYRKACNNTYQDLHIEGLYISGLNGCYYLDPAYVFQQALIKLIDANPMGFEPTQSDSCSDTWRVSIAPCWKITPYWFRDFPNDPNSGQSYPALSPYLYCDSGCCMQQLRVCRGDSLKLSSITSIGDLIVNGSDSACYNLPTDVLPADTNKCFIFCDLISINWINDIIKLPPKDSNPIQSNFKNIKENNVNGILKLTIKANVCDVIRIDVTNVYGTILKTYEQTVKKGIVSCDIDTHSYEKGFYLYRLYCNNKRIGNGKFIVE
jgi:hypothetical protein